jgi:nucleotide-binding universal stress UspA family protein
MKVEIKAGDIIEVINQYTKENQFDLLLLGTRDKYTLFDKLFGTISLGLVKVTSLPVIMIPRFARFKVIDEVLFAIDQNDKVVDDFLKLLEKLTIEDPHISFIEIDTNLENSIRGALMLKEKLSKHNINYNYNFEVIAAKEISKSLLSIAYNKHADIIAISPHQQNFIESLLFKSVSKELILDSKMPMLFVK